MLAYHTAYAGGRSYWSKIASCARDAAGLACGTLVRTQGTLYARAIALSVYDLSCYTLYTRCLACRSLALTYDAEITRRKVASQCIGDLSDSARCT